jgi:hypothetical protein
VNRSRQWASQYATVIAQSFLTIAPAGGSPGSVPASGTAVRLGLALRSAFQLRMCARSRSASAWPSGPWPAAPSSI